MIAFVIIRQQYGVNQLCPLLPCLDLPFQHGFKCANNPFRNYKASINLMICYQVLIEIHLEESAVSYACLSICVDYLRWRPNLAIDSSIPNAISYSFFPLISMAEAYLETAPTQTMAVSYCWSSKKKHKIHLQVMMGSVSYA